MWGAEYKSLQGNMGLGRAIAYFTFNGIPISIPLNDTQGYDLIADYNGKLKRVQIKTTMMLNKNEDSYMVGLRNTGGASGKTKIRDFDKESFDLLFILCQNGNEYLIPVEDISVKTYITLTEDCNKFRLN